MNAKRHTGQARRDANFKMNAQKKFKAAQLERQLDVVMHNIASGLRKAGQPGLHRSVLKSVAEAKIKRDGSMKKPK